MVEIPSEKPPARSSETLRVIARRWHGMIPAVAVLSVLMAFWGATALALGYWEGAEERLDATYPVVAALADGVSVAQAEALAARLRAQPAIRQAKAVAAETALEGALPSGEDWAVELRRIEVLRIPPTLVVVVENGVRDRAARAKGVATISAEGGRMIDYLWPDGLDLLSARQRAEVTRNIINQLRWIVLGLVVVEWLAFLFVDMRHFVYLVGRAQTRDYLRENFTLRRFGASLTRGLIVAVSASVLVAGLIALMPLLFDLPEAPRGLVGASIVSALALTWIVSLSGHSLMGLIVWRHAQKPLQVSIRA